LRKDILATTLSVESQVKTVFTSIIALLLGYFADRFGLANAMMIVTGIFIILVPLISLRTKKG